MFGLGTSSKILSSPHPLGGFSGFELGISFEVLNIKDLSDLGNKIDSQSDFLFPRISIGKGLYHNIDVFLHFVPLTESTGFSEFGADVRWVFFQAMFFPTTFSLLVHGNSSNIANKIIAETSGFDFIAGINVNSFAMYLGVGQVVSLGSFIGGTLGGITDSQVNERETVSSFHSVIGTSLQFGSFFAALQIDRYLQPVYSIKLGVRY